MRKRKVGLVVCLSLETMDSHCCLELKKWKQRSPAVADKADRTTYDALINDYLVNNTTKWSRDQESQI